MIADMKHLKQICSGKIEEIENFSEAVNDSKHMCGLKEAFIDEVLNA